MKWLIASDIHGSAYWCERLIEAYRRERAERLVLLGDILYHGPRNDLPRDYAPKKVAAMLNGLKRDIMCVRGNCDAEVDQVLLEFPIMADYALMSLGERLVFLTHGHEFNTESLPPIREGDILLHGHTHVPVCRDCGGIVYMNPGSVSIPKAGSECGYMTLEGTHFSWRTLSGAEFMVYDA